MSERRFNHKKVRCNNIQKERLLAFMARNKDMARGLVTDRRVETQKWQMLQRELARLGSSKTVEQWKITWRDLKCRAKLTQAPRNFESRSDTTQKVLRYYSRNSHGPSSEDKLILSIIGELPTPNSDNDTSHEGIVVQGTATVPSRVPSGCDGIASVCSEPPDVSGNTEVKKIVFTEDGTIHHKGSHIKSEVEEHKTTDCGGKDPVADDQEDPFSNSCTSPANHFEDEVEMGDLIEREPDAMDNNNCSDEEESDKEVHVTHHQHHASIGAGTAGCVLAARLSEDPTTKVLLVEAGDHMGYFTKVPLTATAAQQGPNDWAVKTTPQKYSSFGMWTQSQFLPRGKGLGGSGQINFLLHGTGHPADYQRWATLGFPWTYEDLKPYFVKAFGSVRNDFDSDECSMDGDCPGDQAPMKLKPISDQDELYQTFKRASALLTDKQTTFRRTTASVKNGRRHGTLDAYLKPAMRRKNLHVLLKTQAVSIRFENSTASSLYILQNHRELNNIFVNKEIILCAGAIKTPQLLILSGIGPEKVLRRLRLKPISLIEDVGANFHDHTNMPVYVSIQRPISITLAKVFSLRAVFDYLWNGEGPLAFPPVAGVEFRNETAVILFSMGTASEKLLRDLSNYKPKVFRDTFPFYNQTSKEGFMFLATCLHPSSRGTVSVVDPSISTAPRVDPTYLQLDVTCIIRAIRRAEKLVSTKPFQDIGARIHWPRPERCLSLWNYSVEDQRGMKIRRIRKEQTRKANTKPSRAKSPPDEYLECIIREVAVTGHHAGGTCAGGRVVDDQLRVRSVSGLRVVDASVLPAPVLFPNSVLVAAAERAADLIRA